MAAPYRSQLGLAAPIVAVLVVLNTRREAKRKQILHAIAAPKGRLSEIWGGASA